MTLPRNAGPEPDDDALVASAVRAAAARPVHGDACPDVDLLAMYAEADLVDERERRPIDVHLAECARCQAIVAACVRARPDDAEQPSRSSAPATGGWFAGWRWLLPVASVAAVAVVAVWIRPDAPRSDAGRPESGAQGTVASAPTSALSEASGERPTQSSDLGGAQKGPARSAAGAAAPAAPIEARLAAPEASGGSAGQPATGARPADAKESSDVLRRNDADSRRAALARERGEAFADAPQTAIAEAVPPPASPPGPANAVGAATPAVAPGAPPVARADTMAVADTAAVARDEKASTAEAGSAGAARSADATPTRQGAGARPAPTAAAPSAAAPAFRAALPRETWRVVQGRIERSVDAGTTWQRSATPDGVAVVAVSPVSVTVCWAIGERAVIRTTGGTSWTRLPTPSDEVLRSVAATTASSAVVTTATGARWTTSDGGATWQRVP